MAFEQRIIQWLRQLARSRERRVLGGVCEGLGAGLAIEPTLLRLAMVVLALAGGLGIAAYGLLWLVLPLEGDKTSSLLGILRSNLGHLAQELAVMGARLREVWSRGREDRSTWPRPLDRRWLGIGALALGAAVLLHSLGLFSWLGPSRLIALLLMLGGAATLLSGRGRW